MSAENNSISDGKTLEKKVLDLKLQLDLLSGIVSQVAETDQTLTKQTIGLLTENIKVLVSNQQVLENKLDDTLKNQFNTDQVVNELNWKVTRLLQLTSLELSNSNTETKKFTTAKITALNTSATKPSTVQVDGAKMKITKNDMLNSLNNTVTKLPIKHSIPKSKRYFNDPAANNKLLSVHNEDKETNKETNMINLQEKKAISSEASNSPATVKIHQDNEKIKDIVEPPSKKQKN